MKETLSSMGKVLKDGYSVADLHMHSTFSRDVRRGMTPEEIALSAESSNLQAVAITDHDDLRSFAAAFDFAQKQGLKVEVIPGMEITTREGHLIGLFINNPIPSNMTMIESIRIIHSQGGLAIAAHPFFLADRSVNRETLQEIMESEDPDVYLDGFEIYNKGVEDILKEKKRFRDTNIEAQNFFSENNNLGTCVGSSDGHRMTVGRALTAFKGELKEVIKNRNTIAVVLDPQREYQLVLNAIELFGEERVLHRLTLEEIRKRIFGDKTS